MIIYPSVDLFEGKVVRLYKGDYDQMTVYSTDPAGIINDYVSSGATHLHVVDLEGARLGTTPNLELICSLRETSGLFVEVGGGIRNMDTVDAYLSSGIDRVILGTAAVTDRAFLESAVGKYGKRIAVGVDIKDGSVAIRGWTEKSGFDTFGFCDSLDALGVGTVICTDISKDGAMAGTNHELYRELSARYSMDIIASGGVSSISDVERLASLGIHGAIIGKAYFTGRINIKEAIAAAGKESAE